MSFAIIRGSNGRRHEVDFADAEIEVDVAIGSETVQITSKRSMIWPRLTSGASPPSSEPAFPRCRGLQLSVRADSTKWRC